MTILKSQSCDGIYLLENWIKTSESKKIIQLAEQIPHSMNSEELIKTNNSELQKILHTNAIGIGFWIQETFNKKIAWQSSIPGINILNSKNHTPEPHADNETLDGKPKQNCENFDIAAIMYLNSDFDGGELEFISKQILIKPKFGDVIAFPGDIRYLHQVKKITNGTRRSSSMWFSIIE